MAKKPTTIKTSAATLEATTTNDVVLSYADHSVRLVDLSPTALAYLAQYGFAKSLQDSVAGVKKEVADIVTAATAINIEGAVESEWTDQEKKLVKEYRELVDTHGDLPADDMATAEIARLHKIRYDNILAGEVGTGGGSRLSPSEAGIRVKAGKELQAIAKASGMKMPKGAEREIVIEAYVADQRERLLAEWTAEQAATKAFAQGASAIWANLIKAPKPPVTPTEATPTE